MFEVGWALSFKASNFFGVILSISGHLSPIDLILAYTVLNCNFTVLFTDLPRKIKNKILKKIIDAYAFFNYRQKL